MKLFEVVTIEREITVFASTNRVEAESEEEAVKKVNEQSKDVKHIDSETVNDEEFTKDSIEKYLSGEKKFSELDSVQEITPVEKDNYIQDRNALNSVVVIINDDDENGMHGEIGVCQAILPAHKQGMCINYVITFDIEEGRTRTLCYIREEFEIVKK